MATAFSNRVRFVAVVAASFLALPALAADPKPPEPAVLSDGDHAVTKRIENSHLMRFIEMYLAGTDPETGDIVAECYGTYANPDIPADKTQLRSRLLLHST